MIDFNNDLNNGNFDSKSKSSDLQLVYDLFCLKHCRIQLV